MCIMTFREIRKLSLLSNLCINSGTEYMFDLYKMLIEQKPGILSLKHWSKYKDYFREASCLIE